MYVCTCCSVSFSILIPYLTIEFIRQILDNIWHNGKCNTKAVVISLFFPVVIACKTVNVIFDTEKASEITGLGFFVDRFSISVIWLLEHRSRERNRSVCLSYHVSTIFGAPFKQFISSVAFLFTLLVRFSIAFDSFETHLSLSTSFSLSPSHTHIISSFISLLVSFFSFCYLYLVFFSFRVALLKHTQTHAHNQESLLLFFFLQSLCFS